MTIVFQNKIGILLNLFVLAAVFLLVATASAVTPDAAPVAPKLRFVVILTRHGVRSPTWTLTDLNAYSSEPWPDWGVAPGHLTPQGYKLMTLIGSYYRLYFANAGLLPSNGCQIRILTDSESRTLETGKALAAGMVPECGTPTQTVGDGKDPLFSPLVAGIGNPDRALAVASIAGRIGGNPDALVEVYRSAFDTLREILFGCAPRVSCPAEEKAGKRSVLKEPSSLDAGKGDHSADLSGPLRTGSTLSEDFLLEYVNGMNGKELGWGRLDAEKLMDIMRLHAAYANLARQTQYIARVQGSNLLSHILHSMEQSVNGRSVAGSLGDPGDRSLSSLDTTQTFRTSQVCWELTGCSMATNPTTHHRGVHWYLKYGNGKRKWWSPLLMSHKAWSK
jgi:4-phytase/acid phosphatase